MSRCSWSWSAIINLRAEFRKNVIWRISRGDSIHPKTDPWLPLPDCQLHPAIPWELTVKDLLVGRQWNLPLINDLFTHEEAILIGRINPNGSSRDKEDTLIWKPTTKGNFTAKSAYSSLSNGSWQSSSSLTQAKVTWKLIWQNKYCIPRVKLFVWKMMVGALLVRSVLHLKRREIDPTCPFCSSEPESIEHLLLTCNFARVVWFSCKLAIRSDADGTNLEDWIFKTFDHLKDHKALALCFNDSPPLTSPPTVSSVSLTPLDKTEIDIHYGDLVGWTDAAWKGSNEGGAGLIILEFPADIYLGKATLLTNCHNSLHGEMLAMRLLIEEVYLKTPASKVWLFSDCQVLVNILNEHRDQSISWELASIVNECLERMKELPSIRICYTSRKNNFVAHSLARFALANRVSKVWLNPPCDFYCNLPLSE
ncbi:uncharacterized protein [Typha latifolia]|uniref:uncharacterized protein n=1 Tax=Typha latifolia TaxID=4733 RepID=UPI003C2F0479